MGSTRVGIRRLAMAAAAAVIWFAGLHPSVADQAQPTSADPALEARVNRLSAELRCLVCQNQSLADSHADLAIDLKNKVRDQLKAGRTDEQVIDYMTERYGDFVLYRPPVKATTLLLWSGPLLLLLAGGLLWWRSVGASARAPDADLLSSGAQAQASALLEPISAAPADAGQPARHDHAGSVRPCAR